MARRHRVDERPVLVVAGNAIGAIQLPSCPLGDVGASIDELSDTIAEVDSPLLATPLSERIDDLDADLAGALTTARERVEERLALDGERDWDFDGPPSPSSPARRPRPSARMAGGSPSSSQSGSVQQVREHGHGQPLTPLGPLGPLGPPLPRWGAPSCGCIAASALPPSSEHLNTRR